MSETSPKIVNINDGRFIISMMDAPIKIKRQRKKIK